MGNRGASKDETFYLWWAAAAFAAVAVASLVIAPAANAETVNRTAKSSTCVSIEFAKKDLEKKFPMLNVTPFTGEKAKDFMAAYNAEPPVSDKKWTAQLVIHHKDSDKAVIFFFDKGCFVYKDTMKADKVRWFMGMAIPTGITV